MDNQLLPDRSVSLDHCIFSSFSLSTHHHRRSGFSTSSYLVVALSVRRLRHVKRTGREDKESAEERQKEGETKEGMGLPSPPSSAALLHPGYLRWLRRGGRSSKRTETPTTTRGDNDTSTPHLHNTFLAAPRPFVVLPSSFYPKTGSSFEFRDFESHSSDQLGALDYIPGSTRESCSSARAPRRWCVRPSELDESGVRCFRQF